MTVSVIVSSKLCCGVALGSLSSTAEFLVSLGLLLLLTLAKAACADKVADFRAPFMKNLASKMQLMYLVV